MAERPERDRPMVGEGDQAHRGHRRHAEQQQHHHRGDGGGDDPQGQLHRAELQAEGDQVAPVALDALDRVQRPEQRAQATRQTAPPIQAAGEASPPDSRPAISAAAPAANSAACVAGRPPGLDSGEVEGGQAAVSAMSAGQTTCLTIFTPAGLPHNGSRLRKAFSGQARAAGDG